MNLTSRLLTTKLPEGAGHLALLVIRVTVSGFMLTHGIPKVMRLFSGDEIRFADPFGFGPSASLALATFAEFLCSIAILIGLGTRIATIPLMGTMLVAAFYAHSDDPFGTKEKPLLFVIVYFALLVFGSGKYSVDHLISGRRR